MTKHDLLLLAAGIGVGVLAFAYWRGSAPAQAPRAQGPSGPVIGPFGALGPRGADNAAWIASANGATAS